MKIVRHWQTLAWMSAITLGASTGWGQSNPDVLSSTQPDELRESLMQLEREVQHLRSQPQPSCEPVGNYLEPCCCENNYYAGFEFVFLKPHLKKSVAYSVTTYGPLASRNDVLYEYNHDTTPRIILGMNNCDGLGVRAIYWTFDDSAGESRYNHFVGSPAGVITPMGRNTIGGQTLIASQSIELDAFDLEATQQFQLGQLYGLASAGARYGHYRRYTRLDTVTGGNSLDYTEWSDDEFHGIGPTVSLELTRPINCSRWSLYSKARGSILFGESDTRMVNRQIIGGPFGYVQNQADDDSVIAIYELQMGIQYACGMWTFRAGWEGQFWDDPGISISPQGLYNPNDLGLTGFNLSVGCTY